MGLPPFTTRQLIEAGVHFGHNTHRWNPKMKPYIFGARNGIHIINLDKTVPMLKRALDAIYTTVAGGGHILFVGTKRRAREPIANAANQCQQYYINHRWLGGTLTNWHTISQSIQHLKDLGVTLDNSEDAGFTKRELLSKQREFDKLNRVLIGIKDMPGKPDMIFILDTNIDMIAVKEANKLGVPIAAVVDTNSKLDGIDYPIPGNDDSGRAISLYCDLVAATVLEGLTSFLSRDSGDLGSEDQIFESEVNEDAIEEHTATEEASQEEPTAEVQN